MGGVFGDVGQPQPVDAGRGEVALHQVVLGGRPGRAAAVSSPVQALDPRLAQEPGDPLGVEGPAPAQREFGVDPGPAGGFPGFFVDLLKVFEQQRVHLIPGRGRPPEPRVVARPRHPQDSASHRDIGLGIGVLGEVTDQPVR